MKDGTAAITNATNADEINQAFDTGKTNIDNAHQPGTAVDDQKANQKKALDDIAANVKKAIQDDPTLTTAEKQQQTANVDKALKDAKDAIDAAKDADSINQAFSDGKTNIEKAHQPGQTLDDQKNNQKKALDDKAIKIKQAIQGDPTLTTAEKNQQIAEVDKAVKDGKDAIDAGTNADEINKAFTDAKNNVDQAHKPGTAVDDQKDAQKKLLDEEAAKVKQDIKDDPTLTTAEKQQQSENVDKVRKDGQAAIDAATNADDINKAFETGKVNIDNAHQPGKTLDEQKAAQKKSLDEEAAKVKQDIQNDPTLTTTEKQQQAENVDKARKDGQAAIDAATTPDEVNQAFETGKVNIDNAHQPGTSLDDQKAAQKKSLADEATKVKQAIQDDPTLTTAEKQQQSENVDKAFLDGQKAIDQAQDADSVNTAFATGKANIDAQHQPGKSLADQRLTATTEIDKETAKVKQQIDNDPLLTDAEKADQKAKVDHEAALAKEALAKAMDADALNAALADGIKKIDAQYVPGTAKTPTPDQGPKPLTVDPQPTTTRPLSTTQTPTSPLPRTGDKPATGLAALGAFILSMFGFALTGKKRKRS
ncbi:cell surface protein [Lacticaseibacillus casei DSM 20011 = JCM 1134 = ATCC 393]|uniref:Cell surface protein n=1 Tax=Lacticaseibacillus casei DSM 20011 = JCM 1134 = ATCC 393 TaxID=1423732 RepID=A0AAD1ARW2_LACCA|nr:cell surface protein [Lacticaseibacillus casei DSM 20011 = JCM 1134 = ATCC 393]